MSTIPVPTSLELLIGELCCRRTELRKGWALSVGYDTGGSLGD
jgi:hypothetical protein